MVTQQQTPLHIVGNKLNADIRQATQSASIPTNDNMPTTGFVRIWQVVGDCKRSIAPLAGLRSITVLNPANTK